MRYERRKLRCVNFLLTYTVHTHIHTQTGLVPLAVTLVSYFSHKAYMYTVHERTHLHCYVHYLHTIFDTYTHTNTQTCLHAQTEPVPLAVTLRSYFSLFSQNIHVHECTHVYTNVHTCTHTHTEDSLAVIWGSYFSHCFHKAYTHTHTHRRLTCSDFVFLFLTLFSQSVYVHECTHMHCFVNSLYTIFVTHSRVSENVWTHAIFRSIKPFVRTSFITFGQNFRTKKRALVRKVRTT